MRRSHEQYIRDVSQLTGLPDYMVVYLMKIFKLLVGHEIFECMIDNDEYYESLCMGLGKLRVEFNADTDDYEVSFKLSRGLKSVLDKMLEDQKSPLADGIDKAFTDEIIRRFRMVVKDE